MLQVWKSASSGGVAVAFMGGGKVADFTEDDSEVLVKIVKAAQSRKVKGSKGEWKDFLRRSKQLRTGPSDPAKRPWTTLADFVGTLTDDTHIEMVKQIRAWELRKKKFEDFEAEGIWRDSPEQELVRLTYRHRRFCKYYTFPSSHKGWVMTDLKDGQSKQERILSLDCEMVVCDDNKRELVRVCVVDNEEKVLLDILVKPSIPVIDYLTPITGIYEADLKNVTCDFVEAQTAVLKLLTANTILVGHTLHNDLNALKIDHLRVIDTSFLFQVRNKPESYRVGLNSLCKAILGYEFQDDDKPHDCLLDAAIPMRIVRHVLKHGIMGPIDVKEKMVDEAQLCKLYFHGIPQPVSVNDLQKLIPDDRACDFDAISWGNNTSGSTYAVFSCINDANEVFEELTGLVGEDSYGRPQKAVTVTVFSKHGRLKKVPVKVRKMSTGDGAHREGAMQAEVMATGCLQPAEDIKIVSLKRRKIADAGAS